VRTPTSQELLLFKNHTLLYRVEAPSSSRSEYIIVFSLCLSYSQGWRRGDRISGYTFSSHCAALKGVQ